MGIHKSDGTMLYSAKTGWCGRSESVRQDELGEFCVCDHCVRMVTTIAGDTLYGPPRETPLSSTEQRFLWRTLAGLAWAGFFELAGLGAA